MKISKLLESTVFIGKGYSSSQRNLKEYSCLLLKPNGGRPLGESCVMIVSVCLQEGRLAFPSSAGWLEATQYTGPSGAALAEQYSESFPGEVQYLPPEVWEPPMNQRQLFTSSLHIFEEEPTAVADTNGVRRGCSLEFERE